MNNLEQFPERFQAVRVGQRLNKTTFASELGISQPHVTSLECGRKKPSKLLIKVIALRFGISEKWLKTGEGSMTDKDGHHSPGNVREIAGYRTATHEDIVSLFQDKEKARQFNMDLVELERQDPAEYHFLRGMAAEAVRKAKGKKKPEKANND